MSKITSPLIEGANQFRKRPISTTNGDRAPDNRVGLKRTRLRRVAKSRAAELKIYYESAPAFFSEPENEFCRICVVLKADSDDIQVQPATERHHHRGRIGRLLNWRPGQMPSCRSHREWPHQNQKRARKLGLLAPAHLFNTFPG